jgi:uncharacterized coiled-coil protein SlyX
VDFLKKTVVQTKQVHERSIRNLNHQLTAKDVELARLRSQLAEMQAKLDSDKEQVASAADGGDDKVATILKTSFNELCRIDGSSFGEERKKALQFLVFLCGCPQTDPLQCSLSVLGRAAMNEADRDFIVTQQVKSPALCSKAILPLSQNAFIIRPFDLSCS